MMIHALALFHTHTYTSLFIQYAGNLRRLMAHCLDERHANTHKKERTNYNIVWASYAKNENIDIAVDAAEQGCIQLQKKSIEKSRIRGCKWKKDQRSSNEFSMSLEVTTRFLFCIALHHRQQPTISLSQRHSSSFLCVKSTLQSLNFELWELGEIFPFSSVRLLFYSLLNVKPMSHFFSLLNSSTNQLKTIFVQRSIGIHFRFSLYWASLNGNNTHTIYWNIQSRRIEKDWMKWMSQSHWMCHRKMVNNQNSPFNGFKN